MENNRPAGTYQFVCPLNYGILGDPNYVLTTATEQEAPNQKCFQIIATAIIELDLTNTEPVASP